MYSTQLGFQFVRWRAMLELFVIRHHTEYSQIQRKRDSRKSFPIPNQEAQRKEQQQTGGIQRRRSTCPDELLHPRMNPDFPRQHSSFDLSFRSLCHQCTLLKHFRSLLLVQSPFQKPKINHFLNSNFLDIQFLQSLNC